MYEYLDYLNFPYILFKTAIVRWRLEQLVRAGVGTEEEFGKTCSNIKSALTRVANRQRNMRRIDGKAVARARRNKRVAAADNWIVPKEGTPFFR